MQVFALAECATHVAQSAKPRRVAFTLAEVLITLGIIGVVAALTLPTLIANYQKQVYVNQLKKSVSVLSQGFTTMMGHDGVTRLSDTEAFAGIPNSNCSPTNILTDDCRSLKEGLESVFASMRFSPGNGANLYFLNGNYANLKSTNSQLIEFPDGSEIWNYGFYKMPVGSAYSAGGYVGFLYLDVNGSKNPNTVGRDIFQVYIGNNGTVYAAGSQVASEMFSGNPNTYYWRTAAQNSSFTCSPDSYGEGCAARVLEEDAMNY